MTTPYNSPRLTITQKGKPNVNRGPFGSSDELVAAKPYANNVGFMIVMHKRTDESPYPGVEPYCTHVYNSEDQAFYYGNYFSSYTEALRDFNKRGNPDATHNTAE